MAERSELQENRLKSVENAISQIQRQFGKGAIMRLGSNERENIPVIPTGILSVDLALGVGGLPRGRVTEIYGPEASGKTTLALHVIAEAQRRGGNAAFIDAEHALDTSYAERLGVNVDDLLISQPDFGEQALEIAEILMRSGGVDVIVVDSVAALVPRAEIDGNVGDQHVGLQARLMSHAMRKFTGVLNRTNTVLIFINQIRMKIGVMFGNPETTTGGNALKFYSSVRIDIRKSTQIKEGQEVIGTQTKVKVVKNKVAPPFKLAEFDIVYGEGISRTGDLLDLGVTHGLVDKSGAWYAYNDERIGQGRENAKRYLKEHPELMEEIDRKLRLALGMPMEETEAQPPGQAQ
ncbi:MAG: recombinase RecA [Desulfobulbaceae bacterium]|nr:recombinase RecA [Desulfobulbaceae bacterium]